MRFLSVTAFQGLLLALLTTAVIVALYFLKHRRRRFVISSTLLWRRVLEHHLENSLFERLRRIVSVLVAVVIGLLVALAIARPEVDWLTGRTRRAIIVLDTSPTMETRTGDGRSRWGHAVDTALDLINDDVATTQFRIADTAGQFDSPFTADREELRRLIERMHPVIAPARFPDIDSPVRVSPQEPRPSEDAPQIHFITDGVSDVDLPGGVNSISVFESAPNVGITAFEVRSMPSAALAYEAYLEIYNAGKEARRAEVTISGTGQQRIVRSINIPAGESFREALDLSKFEGGGIRASVQAQGDAFSADDVAYAYLPVKRRAKTLLVTRGNRFLETVLKLDSLVDVSVISPGEYTSAQDFDALVLDRFAPEEAPSRPALVIGAQNVPWLRKSEGTIATPAFESWMEDHPVMQHVSLFDVSVEAASRIDASNLSVLAGSRNSLPLIVASDRPRWILLTFDLLASDFPYHAGFPIFIDNALAWFDRERLALRRSPGIVDIPMPGAQVRTMDGQTLPSRAHLAGTVFEAPEPGLYVASRETERRYVAVNFSSRQFSNINQSAVKTGQVPQASLPFLRRELWVYMLSLALLLIGTEWFTYHRRITL
jgi:hypothetical protein